MSQDGFHHALEIGHQIHWYTIDKVLGQGGFGITYLGHDNNLDQRVAIKEFLPTEFAVRGEDQSIKPITQSQDDMYHWALDRFISEARTLAKFDHPNIVRVMAVFEENNAAYMVMRYEEGETLEHIFKTRGILSQAELLDIVLPIIDGLKIVHEAGFIHRDIKPANIFIRADGSPVLIDFGSARQSVGAQTQTLTTLISPGYSPIEQYFTKGEDQGPWTDIYGLASTIFRGVAGKRPVDTMTRSKQILADQPDPYIPAVEVGQGRYTTTFLQAIDQGLEFHHQHRPQDLVTWARQLTREPSEQSFVGSDEATVAAPGATDVKKTTQLYDGETEIINAPDNESDEQSKPGSRKWVWFVLASAIILIIILLMVLIKQPGSKLAPTTGPELSVNDDRPTQISSLLAQAEKDLRANRLTIPRGRNAFERYREVLKIDPNNQTAKDGIRSVITRKMAIIEKAVKNRNFDRAQTHMNQIRELLPDNKKLIKLNDAIRRARNR
jgi:serine/threonine protein kinase